ncbi:hypothetical protein EMGBS3_16280 [Anaerolineaceae bacterium]|nr:hypothetical protein EMGBS3_16280 [Anaerolineaceae bacterium]
MVDVVQALEHVQLGRRSDFIMHCAPCWRSTANHLPLFDRPSNFFG